MPLQAESFPVHIPTHLGPLTQLVVGYRPSFPGDRWHLDRVEVTDEGTGLLYIFFCSAWLGDDNTTELHLKVKLLANVGENVGLKLLAKILPPALNTVMWLCTVFAVSVNEVACSQL